MVARGYAVVVTDVVTHVDGDGARRTASDIGAAARLAHDVRDPEEHRAAAAEALRHGRLGAWFNNAGVGDDGRLDDEPVRRLQGRRGVGDPVVRVHALCPDGRTTAMLDAQDPRRHRGAALAAQGARAMRRSG